MPVADLLRRIPRHAALLLARPAEGDHPLTAPHAAGLRLETLVHLPVTVVVLAVADLTADGARSTRLDNAVDARRDAARAGALPTADSTERLETQVCAAGCQEAEGEATCL